MKRISLLWIIVVLVGCSVFAEEENRKILSDEVMIEVRQEYQDTLILGIMPLSALKQE